MADILHDFPIQASPDRVFAAVSAPAGLDGWWTRRSAGRPRLSEEYVLDFGPDYVWRAVVTRVVLDREFTLQLVQDDRDWEGTHVAFRLAPRGQATWVEFSHAGWPDVNEHFRMSSYCWAMYLRLLRRLVEVGETVPYEKRLDV